MSQPPSEGQTLMSTRAMCLTSRGADHAWLAVDGVMHIRRHSARKSAPDHRSRLVPHRETGEGALRKQERPHPRSSYERTRKQGSVHSRRVEHAACIPTLEQMLVTSGKSRLFLKSDGESVIVALRRQAAAATRATHGLDAVREISLHVRDVKGVLRSFGHAAATLHGVEIAAKLPCIPWKVAFEADRTTRSQQGADRLTTALGECILYLRGGRRDGSRLQDKWAPSVCFLRR